MGQQVSPGEALRRPKSPLEQGMFQKESTWVEVETGFPGLCSASESSAALGVSHAQTLRPVCICDSAHHNLTENR